MKFFCWFAPQKYESTSNDAGLMQFRTQLASGKLNPVVLNGNSGKR